MPLSVSLLGLLCLLTLQEATSSDPESTDFHEQLPPNISLVYFNVSVQEVAYSVFFPLGYIHYVQVSLQVQCNTDQTLWQDVSEEHSRVITRTVRTADNELVLPGYEYGTFRKSNLPLVPCEFLWRPGEANEGLSVRFRVRLESPRGNLMNGIQCFNTDGTLGDCPRSSPSQATDFIPLTQLNLQELETQSCPLRSELQSGQPTVIKLEMLAIVIVIIPLGLLFLFLYRSGYLSPNKANKCTCFRRKPVLFLQEELPNLPNPAEDRIMNEWVRRKLERYKNMSLIHCKEQMSLRERQQTRAAENVSIRFNVNGDAVDIEGSALLSS